jgi:hypothetical protein
MKILFRVITGNSVLGACQAMHNICSDYSDNMGEFKLVRDKDNTTVKLAKECSQNDFYFKWRRINIGTRGFTKYF